MIDFPNEQLVTLAEAARMLRRADGKGPAAAAVWRWAIHGKGGVRLETIKCGRDRVTSVEAIGRFFARIGGERIVTGNRTSGSQPWAGMEGDAEVWTRGIGAAVGTGARRRPAREKSPDVSLRSTSGFSDVCASAGDGLTARGTRDSGEDGQAGGAVPAPATTVHAITAPTGRHGGRRPAITRQLLREGLA